MLYGSGSWLSPTQGAFEVTSHDPGIGVSFAGLEGYGRVSPARIRNEEGICAGIQCEETYTAPITWNSEYDQW